MTPEAIDRVARILRILRLGHQLIENLPDECRPETLQEAYAVQDRLFELLGEETGGWLVGCTNPAIQTQLGLQEPYAARVLASSLFKSPARLHLPTTLPVVLEVEFAFTLRNDLPQRATPYSEDEVASAILSVHPAIEIVLGHLRDWPSKDIFSLIADNGTDGPLVFGAGVTDWRSLDLTAIAVTLSVNGAMVRQGAGSKVMQGPLSVMTWLANCAQRAPGLRAGQVINTGSCTPMYPAEHGDLAVADFGPLGSVTVELATRDSRAR
jgi:2-keto-4-pentenoate hydratase